MSSSDRKSKVIDRKLREKNKQLKREMQDFLSSIDSSFSLSSIDENKVNESEVITPSKINANREGASAEVSDGRSDAKLSTGGDSASGDEISSKAKSKDSGEKSSMMSSYLSILPEMEDDENSEASENDSDIDVAVETEEDDETCEDEDDENSSNIGNPVSEPMQSPGTECNNGNFPPIQPIINKQPCSPLTPTSPPQKYNMHRDKQYDYYNDTAYNNKRNSSFFRDDDSLVAMAKRLDDASIISDPTVICGADDEDYSVGRDDSFLSAESGLMHKGRGGGLLSLTSGEPGAGSANIAKEEKDFPQTNRYDVTNKDAGGNQEQQNPETSSYNNIDDSADPSRQPKHLEILRKAQELNMKAKLRQQKYQQEQPQKANRQINDLSSHSAIWQQQKHQQASPQQKYRPPPPQRQKQNFTQESPQGHNLMSSQVRNGRTNEIHEKYSLNTTDSKTQRNSRSSSDGSSKHEQAPQMPCTPKYKPHYSHNRQNEWRNFPQTVHNGSDEFGNNNFNASIQPKQQTQAKKTKQKIIRPQTRNDRNNPNNDSHETRFSRSHSYSPQRKNNINDDARSRSPFSLDASYESSTDDNNVADRAGMQSSDQAIRTEPRKTSQPTFSSSRNNSSGVPPPPPTYHDVDASTYHRKTSKPKSRRKNKKKNPSKKHHNDHFDDTLQHPDGAKIPHFDDEMDGAEVGVLSFAGNTMPPESYRERANQFDNTGTKAPMPPLSPTTGETNAVHAPQQSGQPSNPDLVGNRNIHRGVRISQWKDKSDDDTPPKIKHRLWNKVPKAKVTQYKDPQKGALDDSMRGLGFNTRIHDKQQKAQTHCQGQMQQGPMPNSSNSAHHSYGQTSSANHSPQSIEHDVGSDYNSDCQTEFFYESGSDDSDDYYESDEGEYYDDDEDLPAVGTSVAQAVADLNNQRPLTKVKNLLRIK